MGVLPLSLGCSTLRDQWTPTLRTHGGQDGMEVVSLGRFIAIILLHRAN